MKNKLFLLLVLGTTLLFAQQKQPKVGLVLSGGGAKGFAHVAVLKEIEAAGIHLDYIAGTSMGAIIGGIYAAGYSAVEIEKIVTDTDFMYLLRDQLPRSTAPFFEKEYGETTNVSLPVIEGGIGFPKALSKGQSVLNLLYELLGDKDYIRDFSKLPTPFFCIATDVETGKGILMESGSLPLALRSSGSFPTLLNPVVLDDKLLVDGGIANNFPVTIMKEKGIDIVIGVDVEGRLYDKDKLTSAIAVLNQITSYKMYEKSSEEKAKLDVYIKPDVGRFGVVDFDKKDEIIEEGEKEVAKFKEVFKEIAAKQLHKKMRVVPKINFDDRLVSEINIKGSENYTRAYVLGKLNLKVGDSISRQNISKKIQLLSATKNYDRIDYQLVKQKDDSYAVFFDLKETKDVAAISLGVHYDLLYKSGLLVNYTQKHMLLENDLFSLDVVLGDNIRYNLNYFVDNGFFLSYGFRSRYNHFRDNTKFNSVVSQYPSLSTINLKYTDITNQFFVQTTFDRKFALGLGIEHKYLKASTSTITVNNEETMIDNSHYVNLFGYLKLDTYDKRYFATKGYFADLNFKWYAASTDYNENFKSFGQAKGTLGFATTFIDKLTLHVTTEAGFTLNSPTSDIFDFHLGGYNQNYINTFVSLYGYDFAELSDDSFIKADLTLRYNFYKRHFAIFSANYARLDSNVFKDIDLFKDIYSGYAAGYSLDTFIGPIELKYSWSPDTKQSYWLFNLGFWF